ncbi:hypothetical protein QYM36_012479 [Artemia franciscana]|uniref:Integrase catalytic domain-containing protein n=1 Tax=Artemia franciscana TaxID=6661 RepID=A0AA88HLS7_ARTSF|nr:hypothetical protein QYM36_012479 [Artemia franciscana]
MSLQPLPIIETPYHKIGIYLMGPLEISKTGFRWMLVIVDYATRYPEAIPLLSPNSQKIADELIKFYPQLGIPSEILTDNGCKTSSPKQCRNCVWPLALNTIVPAFTTRRRMNWLRG